MFPSHVDKRKGTLNSRAFRPRPSTDQISVIRQTHMGTDFCRSKGKEIASKATHSTYVGLAVLTANQIRRVGAEVCDSRQEFCGHAHISYGIVAQPNEPLEPRLAQMVRRLFECATYYEDPDPAASCWTGPQL